MSERKAPTSRELSDAIEQLKADVASLKARFATPPNWELESALTALAAERAQPLSPQEKGEMFEEIQQFKSEISALKNQIASNEQKLSPAPASKNGDDAQ